MAIIPWFSHPPGMPYLHDCVFIDLPEFSDERGSLTQMEHGKGLPFQPSRVFLIRDVPAGARRAAHALRDCHQVLVAVAGSFQLTLWDGKEEKTVVMDDPARGIVLPPMIWRELSGFSPATICLVVASHPHDEAAYFRTREGYLEALVAHG